MLTLNYRFVCPQLAESTNIAQLPNTYNGFYEMLRLESKNPEPPQMLEEMQFQNG